MADDKKPFHINWPKGATLTMDEKSLQEMRQGLEVQFKHIIYTQPGFEFYHSIGNTNFFQSLRHKHLNNQRQSIVPCDRCGLSF